MSSIVSIIMPAFNSENYIEQSIQSVMQQSFKEWELIVVDDCSKDNTIKIVLKCLEQDDRIKLIRLKENQGAAIARNTGLEVAEGRFIAFLDADDLWKPEKLDRQFKFMVDHDVGFSFSAYEILSNSDRDKSKIVHVPSRMSYQDVLKNTRIGTLTVMIDKKITGDFRMPLVRKGQDLLTWVSILKRGFTAYGINDSLAYYRKVPGSLSNNKLSALKRTWVNYHKFLDLNFFAASYYFAHYVFNALKKHYLNDGE